MGAYALESGGQASVTAVLRSNFAAVDEKGISFDSIQHGKMERWKPSAGKYNLSLFKQHTDTI